MFYKELKISTFDAGLAAALGFMPVILHYALMGLVSITVVGAFDIVGSILVVALIVVPPAAAYLLTDRLPRMLGLSVLIGALSAISGYWLANLLDASIAGAMVTTAGMIFGLVFLFAPERGLIAQIRQKARQRWEFAQTMLTIHLLNHDGKPNAESESQLDHLQDHLRWEKDFSSQVVRRAIRQSLIHDRNGKMVLTNLGKLRAQEALVGN